MASDGVGGVDDAVAAIYEREEGVVLLASVEYGATPEAFVKPRPDIERAPTKGHIPAVADASEVCHLEPERMSTVNNPPHGFMWPGIRAVQTRAQALGIRLDGERERAPRGGHHLRVLKFACETGEPLRFGQRIIVEKSDHLRVAGARATIARPAQPDHGLDDDPGAPACRHCGCLRIAGSIVDDDDVKMLVVQT